MDIIPVKTTHEVSYYWRNRERILQRQKEYYRKKKQTLEDNRRIYDIDNRKVIIRQNVTVRF